MNGTGIGLPDPPQGPPFMTSTQSDPRILPRAASEDDLLPLADL